MVSPVITLFQHHTRILASAIRQERETKGVWTGQKRKTTVFVDDRIAYGFQRNQQQQQIPETNKELQQSQKM